MQLRQRAVSLSHTMEDRGTAQSHKPPSKVKRAAERAEKREAKDAERAEERAAKDAEKAAKAEKKKQEQAPKLELAAARKAERSRRSELHKAGMTQDKEVQSEPPSINNALWESFNGRCNICISLKIFNFASHFFRVQIFQIALKLSLSFYPCPNISDTFVGDEMNGCQSCSFYSRRAWNIFF